MTLSLLELLNDEIQMSFVRSSGPGGQNVNKVATAVQLRLDVLNSPLLPDALKERLSRLAGTRMTDEGVLVIEARRFRTQEANRQDALHRLNDLFERAEQVTAPRKPTRPSLASRVKRIEEKRRQGTLKRSRRESIRLDD